MVELAAQGDGAEDRNANRGIDRNAERHETIRGAYVSEAQGIPKKFLENILFDLKRAGLVRTQRGAGGGYQLARAPEEITLADVIRAVEGPLANVRGEWPEDLSYAGAASPLKKVWIALRANLRAVLESVTLADVVHDKLPEAVQELTRSSAAWQHH